MVSNRVNLRLFLIIPALFLLPALFLFSSGISESPVMAASPMALGGSIHINPAPAPEPLGGGSIHSISGGSGSVSPAVPLYVPWKPLAPKNVVVPKPAPKPMVINTNNVVFPKNPAILPIKPINIVIPVKPKISNISFITIANSSVHFPIFFNQTNSTNVIFPIKPVKPIHLSINISAYFLSLLNQTQSPASLTKTRDLSWSPLPTNQVVEDGQPFSYAVNAYEAINYFR